MSASHDNPYELPQSYTPTKQDEVLTMMFLVKLGTYGNIDDVRDFIEYSEKCFRHNETVSPRDKIISPSIPETGALLKTEQDLFNETVAQFNDAKKYNRRVFLGIIGSFLGASAVQDYALMCNIDPDTPKIRQDLARITILLGNLSLAGGIYYLQKSMRELYEKNSPMHQYLEHNGISNKTRFKIAPPDDTEQAR